MRRILYILLIFSVAVDASYIKAKEYFDKKEYKKAIAEAKASKKEYSNPNLHLIWAKSEEIYGNTKSAMSAYERVVMLDENNIEAKMALLKIYKKTKRDILAKELTRELLKYDLTPSQRNSLELLDGEDTSSIKAKATLSIGHDTNINVSAKSSVLDDYYGNINDGEKSTLFARFNGSISYINELKEKGGWYLRGDARAYYQNNFDAHFFDMLLVGAEVGVGYAGSNYTIYLPFGYDRVNYLDVDLLAQIKVQPRLNITLNRDFILNFNAKYSTRDYQDDKYKKMADESVAAGMGLYYIFGRNYAYANLLYEDFSSTKDDHFLFIDKNMYTASFGVNYDVEDMFIAKADYRYRRADYDDSKKPSDTNVAESRVDDFNQFELKISHYFKENFSVYISDRYVINNSNYVPGEYSKNIAMLGLSANY
jgi:hypothetical protein